MTISSNRNNRTSQWQKNRVVVTVLFILCLLMPTLTVYATASIDKTPSGIHFSEIESQIDALVGNYLGITTPGVAVVVVKDGEIIFSRGYGYADIERQITVDPANTIFEYGSISKTFVWVSVMLLVEQGLLDLDADINSYLPEDFISQLALEMPFTMRDLMNHSAGFGGRLLDTLIDVDRVNNAGELRESLFIARPNQIHEPGTITAYSNFGTALAAFVVESISGQSFAEFERQNIFIPDVV